MRQKSLTSSPKIEKNFTSVNSTLEFGNHCIMIILGPTANSGIYFRCWKMDVWICRRSSNDPAENTEQLHRNGTVKVSGKYFKQVYTRSHRSMPISEIGEFETLKRFKAAVTSRTIMIFEGHIEKSYEIR